MARSRPCGGRLRWTDRMPARSTRSVYCCAARATRKAPKKHSRKPPRSGRQKTKRNRRNWRKAQRGFRSNQKRFPATCSAALLALLRSDASLAELSAVLKLITKERSRTLPRMRSVRWPGFFSRQATASLPIPESVCACGPHESEDEDEAVLTSTRSTYCGFAATNSHLSAAVLV